MNKKTTIHLARFERQAQKTISMAFEICEAQLRNGQATPKKKALASATLSLKRAIDVFISIHRIRDQQS